MTLICGISQIQDRYPIIDDTAYHIFVGNSKDNNLDEAISLSHSIGPFFVNGPACHEYLSFKLILKSGSIGGKFRKFMIFCESGI